MVFDHMRTNEDKKLNMERNINNVLKNLNLTFQLWHLISINHFKLEFWKTYTGHGKVHKLNLSTTICLQFCYIYHKVIKTGSVKSFMCVH